MLLKLLALGGLGYAGYRYYEKTRSQPAFAGNQGKATVRDAGPESMRDNSGRAWTPADEASDQSFPASDPPSTY
ncbi:hypothetical protein [Qipengyuania qiaonensis]|uniref:Uncharacterized protein n=1 Tax=Qipengyuania qiaonensis TaxID=2867240 RepID=A0ABS7J9X4_9SPHN|nr:hypothetical protein [Qipengyuania qiaonensis]MBX7481782.1 hypothetical protein [Qipengyuania qiaonensis]